MVPTEPTYHVVIDATFADKVCAIRRLVELYRRTMPARAEALERVATVDARRDLDEPEKAVANSMNG